MNVEIETQTAQFPEKEYINGIFAGYALSPSYIHMSKKGLTQYDFCRINHWFLLFSRQFEEIMAEPEPIPAFEGFSSTIKSFSALAW
jgi:hypothetical protein